MLRAPADLNSLEQLESLLANQTPEGRTLDYKRDLTLDTGEQKKELARDVSSLANAEGGFLVFGVDEDAGLPTQVVGVPSTDFDALWLKMQQILDDHIQPKVRGWSFGKIDHPKGAVVVIYVPRSWIGPHMTALPKQSHFYSRGTAGRVTLDVHEIRNAFLAATQASDRIRGFRDERIGRVVSNEGGMRMDPGPRLVVHLCPFTETQSVFAGLAGKPDKLPPFGNGGEQVSARFNLDGYLTYPTTTEGNKPFCYTMVFKNGAFERCEPVWRDEDARPKLANGNTIERDIWEAADLFFSRSRELGADTPLVIMATIIGMKGIRITGAPAERPWHSEYTVDRDLIVLPEIIVEKSTMSREDFRLMFDSVWQASGWPHSPNFDRDGKWSSTGR